MPNDFYWIAASIELLILLTFLQVIWRISRQSANSYRIEAKLDLLLNHAGISYDPYKSLPAAVSNALDRGDKIAAMREYRKATGADLKAAKEFIEEAQSKRATG